MDADLALREIERTLDYVDRRAPRMRWGRSDCLTICAGIVRRAGGPDIASRYNGRYHDADSMARMLPRGLAAECRTRAREIGARAVRPADAPPGSWGLAQTADRATINVIAYTGGYWLSFTDRGIEYVKSDQVRLAWAFY